MVLNQTLDKIFGGIINYDPVLGLAVVTFIASAIVVVAYKYFSDQGALKRLREESKQLQADVKNFKDDPTKMGEYNKKVMENFVESMKQNWKPMLYTFIPLIILFNWLRTTYTGKDLNFLGLINNWFWVYFILSMVFNSILRKIMKVY